MNWSRFANSLPRSGGETLSREVMDWVRNPRAIPIDRDRIRTVAREIEDNIRHETRSVREPLGEQTLFGVPFRVRLVDGSMKTVPIHVASVETPSKLYVVSGGVGRVKTTGKEVVVVFINGSIPQYKLHQAARGRLISSQLYTVLSHEITHVADAFRGAGLEGVDPRAGIGEERMSAYYNLPTEVRAYMREVVDETSESFKHWSMFVRTFGTSKALHYLLRTSKTWIEVSPYWTEKNRRRVIQAVVKAQQEQEA
jgi:hypothetical protein